MKIALDFEGSNGNQRTIERPPMQHEEDKGVQIEVSMGHAKNELGLHSLERAEYKHKELKQCTMRLVPDSLWQQNVCKMDAELNSDNDFLPVLNALKNATDDELLYLGFANFK